MSVGVFTRPDGPPLERAAVRARPSVALEHAATIFRPPPDQFWRPYPKQEVARELAGRCFELLFGGSAGPGKSMFLRGYACDFAVSHPGAHIAIVRRTLPQLRQTHGLHLPAMIGDRAAQNRSDFTWTFPNGSIIRFISLPNDGDEQQYKSAEFDLLLFDELTEFLESQYTFMLSRVRSAKGHRAHVVATSNPEGQGFRWVKRRFVSPRAEDLGPGQDPPRPGVPWSPPVVDNGTIVGWHPPRAFLPATIQDNPGLLISNPGYVAQLNALPDSRLRRALLDGDAAGSDLAVSRIAPVARETRQLVQVRRVERDRVSDVEPREVPARDDGGLPRARKGRRREHATVV